MIEEIYEEDDRSALFVEYPACAENEGYEYAYEWAEDENAGGIPHGVLLPLTVLLMCGLLVYLFLTFISPGLTTAVRQTNTHAAPKTQGGEGAVSGKLAAFFTPEVKHWEPQVLAWAKEWNLDPNLVATVMQIESCGDPQAVSSAGAMGLFQVMPFHFSNGEDTFDPQVNAQRGIAYLRQAFDARQGDVRTTLASYNGGITGASRPESVWSEEMIRYARWGSGIYQDAASGKAHSLTLQEWLNAGGSSLCAQANQRLASSPQSE